jgi:acetyltransferase-like isoleucine patch superfamily enzyme
VIDPTARVHASAETEADVSIGPRTSVWNRAVLRKGAVLGAECIIGRDAFIDEGVRLGDRVKVQNGALVYHGVTVGNGVFIGPGAILTNDRYPRAITATGELARGDDWVVSPIELRDGCSIGAGAIVVAGNPARRIGWVCACGTRLPDPAGVESGASATTSCPACGRIYDFNPSSGSLAQRPV